MNSFSLSERGFARLRIVCVSAAILSVCCCAASVARAQDGSQDVAEAARQARARKAANPSPAGSHVYTNDDLERAEILVEGDGSRAAASQAQKRNSPLPAGSPATSGSEVAASAAPESAPPESLGEVARRYRRAKAERETERASKEAGASPFPMQVAQPAWAEILPRPASLAPARVAPATVAPPSSEKNLKPGANQVAPTPALKRDPFSRPTPLLWRRRPEIPAVALVKPGEPGPRALRVPANGAFAKRAPSAVRPEAVKTWELAAPRSLPLSPGAPELARVSRGVVAIEAGDSLWKLSRRYLGSGVYWRKWLASNPDLGDPHRLQPGARLVVPETAKGRSGDRPVPVISGHTQTVVARAGDSLWKIAAARYAHGAYWPCVAQANAPLPGKEMIYAGQVLLLPASCENPRRSAPSVAP